MSFSRISFDLTTACNLSCVHCMRKHNTEPNHLSVDIIEKVISQSKRYATDTIVFTGGEPTLHPAFIEVVDMVVKNGLKYFFVTNGTNLSALRKIFEKPERVKAIDAISLSLDGATEETCDAIRGQGVYRKVMKATAFLKQNGKPFGYKLSFNKLNAKEIDKYIIDAMKLGASYIEFSHMHPTPDLVKGDLILPRSQWINCDHQVLNWIKMSKMSITLCAGGYIKYPFYQCSSMQMNDAHVDSKGNLCLCCVLPYMKSADPRGDRATIGNLAEMDLWDANKKLISVIAGLNQSKLKKIANNTFKEIDHYPCMHCFKYFRKLDWLKDLDPNNEWLCE